MASYILGSFEIDKYIDYKKMTITISHLFIYYGVRGENQLGEGSFVFCDDDNGYSFTLEAHLDNC